jgi:hypothetical protein
MSVAQSLSPVILGHDHDDARNRHHHSREASGVPQLDNTRTRSHLTDARDGRNAAQQTHNSESPENGFALIVERAAEGPNQNAQQAAEHDEEAHHEMAIARVVPLRLRNAAKATASH